MINRSQLKFHETFQPELNYISKIVSCAADNFEGDKFLISDKTGIPTGKQKGKVEPTIKYARFMGLIDYSVERGVYKLNLTNLGNEIFVQDKYLHENLTKWLCHYGITSNISGAAQWAFLIHQAHEGFVRTVTSDHLLSLANKVFGVDMGFEELFGVVKRSYNDGCFSLLSYLEWEDNTIRFLEHKERQELIFAYAYALLNSWETIFSDKNEITMTELKNSIGINRIFGFNESELEEMLETFSNEGILSINRQLYPATFIRTSHSANIIPALYSRLL